MSLRSLSRQTALQTLFELDMSDGFGMPRDTIKEIIIRDKDEWGTQTKDTSFIEEIVYGVIDRMTTIDEIITKAAPDWPLDKINNIDRNILRIGLFELLFADKSQVPPKVAIDEAIELAKSYSGETSGKFVNGVLGAVYKEMGEPGKHDKPERKLLNKIEPKAGALVYSVHEGRVYVAMVHDIFGHWTLSKGGVKEGEDTKLAAIREVKEEIGIEIEIIDYIGENEYIANDPEGKVKRTVTYYLAKAEYQDLKLEESGGLDDARWFHLSEIASLKVYNDIYPIIEKGLRLIKL